MKKFEVKIKLPKKTINEMNKLLKQKVMCDDYGRDQTIETFTAHFDNGMEMDIRICNGSEEDSPYICYELFDKGEEIDSNSSTTEKLNDSFTLFDGEDTYIVKIISELPKKKPKKK